MRVLLLLFFAAVDYYVVLVFFREKSRRNALSSFLWLIGYFVLSSLTTRILFSAGIQSRSQIDNTLISFGIVLTVAFFCQLVAIMIKRAINWHREHNKANLHRQPIRFAIEQQGKIITFATYFYFLASLLILWGIWLGPTGRTA
jgi:hypothetical protein